MKQVSIFIENKTGSLSTVCKVLAEGGINLRALSIADTQDFGILRIIVENTEKTMEILKKNGYICKTNSVLAVEIPDQPGAMASIMDIVSVPGVSVEYAYAFASHKANDSAYMIFRVSGYETAKEVLEKAGIHLLTKEELFEK
jgi:hypothetical protein